MHNCPNEIDLQEFQHLDLSQAPIHTKQKQVEAFNMHNTLPPQFEQPELIECNQPKPSQRVYLFPIHSEPIEALKAEFMSYCFKHAISNAS